MYKSNPNDESDKRNVNDLIRDAIEKNTGKEPLDDSFESFVRFSKSENKSLTAHNVDAQLKEFEYADRRNISDAGNDELDKVFTEGKMKISEGTQKEIDDSLRESIDYDPDYRILEILLKRAVPEIRNGIVEIVDVARIQGIRCKISIRSHDPNLDPISAVVGFQGQKINSVVDNLNGEKIDIVVWDENPANYIQNALIPANVINVFADEDSKTAKVVVPDFQLTLAIGKNGQNLRLASSLTGYQIEIKNETQAKDAYGFRREDYLEEDYEDYEDYLEEDDEESADDSTIYYRVSDIPPKHHLKYALFEYKDTKGIHSTAALFDERDYSGDALPDAILNYLHEPEKRTFNNNILFIDAHLIDTVFRSLF